MKSLIFNNKLSVVIAALVIVFALALPGIAFADAADDACRAIGGSAGSGTGGCTTAGEGSLDNVAKSIVNLLSLLVGIVAVIMIIFGGFKYITSGGDANAAKTARNTILYAIIGLIVVALAQVIVRFTLNEVTTPSASPTNSRQNRPV